MKNENLVFFDIFSFLISLYSSFFPLSTLYPFCVVRCTQNTCTKILDRQLVFACFYVKKMLMNYELCIANLCYFAWLYFLDIKYFLLGMV